MLKDLNVENYALIDKLNISFSEGMSIITGETGAGKSILLGALSLVLGGRADVSVLKDKERNCVVEASFEVEGCGLEHLLEKNEIDCEPELIVRRTINPAGKSRAFVNDVPVNAGVLKDIGTKLLDVHSQHENLLLSNSKFQLSALDAITDFGNLKTHYGQYFDRYRSAEKRLEELLASNAKSKADYDYVKYQFEQLERMKLKSGEQEELETEVAKLSNIEEIKSGYEKLSALLSGDDISVINMLKEAAHLLTRLQKTYQPAAELAVRTDGCLVEIKDIAAEIDKVYDSLYLDPEMLAAAETRLNGIYELQQKHRVGSIDELLRLQAEYEQSLKTTDSLDEAVATTEKEMNENLKQAKALAGEISEARRQSIPLIEQHVTGLLKSLGMPNVVFRVELVSTERCMPEGMDEISFLFSANRDAEPREISKVASGGEMSRLMLALKSLLVKGMKLPTIIFDEIDTGVSGEVADKMGSIIRELSQKTQVINITHLPQIASKGKSHYLVYKEDTPSATHTRVRRLNGEERIMEIAKMLSGSHVTEAALEHAKELLNHV
ncbi:MAG: DNA repair protein RecN [Prevotellaceae bacterium]|jgi:DNA repair protein RecN (Recombination protein N)|nr:DNA repair protein RecN [Prevotellaceae bacterium]